MNAHPSTIRRGLLVLATAALLAILLPAFGGNDGLRAASRTLFSPVCHQKATRSFAPGDRQLPVCARCLGLYLGAFAMLWALELLPSLRSRIDGNETGAATAIVVCAAVMGLDVAGQALALWTHLPASALTGLGLGAAVPAWVHGRAAALAAERHDEAERATRPFPADEETRRWSI